MSSSSSSYSTPASFLPFGSSSSSSGGGGFFSRRKNARRLSVQTQVASSSSSSSRHDHHGLSVPQHHGGSSYVGSQTGSHTSHTGSDRSFASSTNNKHHSHSGTATVRSASAMAMSDSHMPPPTQHEVVYVPRKIPSMDEVRSRAHVSRSQSNRNHHHHQHQPHQHTHTQVAPRTAGLNGSAAPRQSLTADFRDPPRSTGHGHRSWHRSWQSTTTHPASARSVPTDSPQSSDRAADYRMRRYSERPFPSSTGPSPLPSPYPFAASSSYNNNTFQPALHHGYVLDNSPSQQAQYADDESDPDSEANLDPVEVLETFFEHAPEQLPTWIETLINAEPPTEPPKSPPPTPAPPLPHTPDRRNILLLPPNSPSTPSPRRVAQTSHSTPGSAMSTPMSTSPAHSPRSPPNGYAFSRPPLSLQLPGRLRRRSASASTSEDHSSPGSGSVPIHQRPLPPVPPSPNGGESSIRGRLLRGRRRSTNNDVNIPHGIEEESSEPLDTMIELEENPEPPRDFTKSPPVRYESIPPPTNSATSGATRPWSVVAHIIPTEERAMIGSHRRGSTSSVDSQASDFTRPFTRGMTASPLPAVFTPPLPSSPFRSPPQAYPVGLTPPPRPPVGLTPPPRPRSSMQGSRPTLNAANHIGPSPIPYSSPGRELSW